MLIGDFGEANLMAYQRTPYIETKRAQARGRLVQAAVSLIGLGGWREVQMSAVATEAGLSTGAVYLHFPSKTELLSAVYRSQADAELQVIASIAAEPGSAADRLAAAIRAFSRRALSNRRLAYAMVHEPTEAEVEQERLRFHREFIAQYRRILESGCAAGEFDIPDTEVVAACVFGSVIEALLVEFGLANQGKSRAAGGSRQPAADGAETVVDFCLRGIPRPATVQRAKPSGRRAATAPVAPGG
jgi:AcrR family transcriptional regulator